MSVDDLWERIKNDDRTIGALICTSSDPILTVLKHNFSDDAKAEELAGKFASLAAVARDAVQCANKTNELSFVRLRTGKEEILVAPDAEYILVVQQRLNATE